MSSVGELIEKLQQLPAGWRAVATRSGSSIEVWDPEGSRYGYVFTDDRDSRFLTDKKREREAA